MLSEGAARATGVQLQGRTTHIHEMEEEVAAGLIGEACRLVHDDILVNSASKTITTLIARTRSGSKA